MSVVTRIIGVILVVAILPSGQINAQSGTRIGNVGNGGGFGSVSSATLGGYSASRLRFAGLTSRQRRALQAEQQQTSQQAALLSAQRTAESQQQRRLVLLNQLAKNPNAKQNRDFSRLAVQEARSQFRSLVAMDRNLTGAELLSQPFRLTSREIDRMNGRINWPSSLKTRFHKPLIVEFEQQMELIRGGNAADIVELNRIINELSGQVAQRVKEMNIRINDFANAKKFLTGLAIEVNYPSG